MPGSRSTGSVALGEADEWSDLDLVIVTETDRPSFERHKDFADVWDVWPQLDLLPGTSNTSPAASLRLSRG